MDNLDGKNIWQITTDLYHEWELLSNLCLMVLSTRLKNNVWDAWYTRMLLAIWHENICNASSAKPHLLNILWYGTSKMTSSLLSSLLVTFPVSLRHLCSPSLSFSVTSILCQQYSPSPQFSVTFILRHLHSPSPPFFVTSIVCHLNSPSPSYSLFSISNSFLLVRAFFSIP